VAKRGRDSAIKRAKEKARMEKQAAKRERRATRSTADEDETATDVDEKALWEEYAHLSERHASKKISFDRYDEERTRILTELGIESDQ